MILDNKNIEKIDLEKQTLIVTNESYYLEDDNFGVISLVENYTELFMQKDLILYDKLIGRGAAILINSFDVKAIYAKTITKEAYEILSAKCNVKYSKIVENILNRDRSDLCPIEKISCDENDSQILLEKLRQFYIERGYLNV